MSIIEASDLLDLREVLFPHQGRIEEYVVTGQDNSGQEVQGWVASPGLTSIAYGMAPLAGSTEARNMDTTVGTDLRLVRLAGYFPNITRAMRFVAEDEVIWNIRSVQSDGTDSFTELIVELVQPGGDA